MLHHADFKLAHEESFRLQTTGRSGFVLPLFFRPYACMVRQQSEVLETLIKDCFSAESRGVLLILV